MKTLNLSILHTFVVLLSTIIFVGCSSEIGSINKKELVELSIEEYQNRVSNLLVKSDDLSGTIVKKYSHFGALRNSQQLTKEQIILDDKHNIVALVESEFPEFTYDPSLDNNEEFVSLIRTEEIPTLVANSTLSSLEKEFMINLVSLSEINNQTGIYNLIQDFKDDLQISNLNFEDKERANYMISTMESIYNAYSTASDRGSAKVSSNCGQAAAEGALGGAMIGALKGFIKGCWTGVFLGFNPGSVAAGCLGGMIVGMVEGAVTGAVGAGVACELGITG